MYMNKIKQYTYHQAKEIIEKDDILLSTEYKNVKT